MRQNGGADLPGNLGAQAAIFGHRRKQAVDFAAQRIGAVDIGQPLAVVVVIVINHAGFGFCALGGVGQEAAAAKHIHNRPALAITLNFGQHGFKIF